MRIVKLALILVRNKQEPLILHEPEGKHPRMLLLGWKEQLAFLLLVAIAAAWLWFGLFEPIFRHTPQPAVRVPRAAQVMPLEREAPLHVGDTIFFAGAAAPGAGRIAALPRESVFGRDPYGPEKLVILGLNQYYVVTANGTGRVLVRADMRGMVQSQL
jgi:hypothetical protein